MPFLFSSKRARRSVHSSDSGIRRLRPATEALEPRCLMATRVWDGGDLTSANWSRPINWVGNVAPVEGDLIEFPVSAARRTNVNDFPSGTFFSGIRITGGAASYSISGNSLQIGADGISDSPGSNVNTIALPLLLPGGFPGSTTTVTVNGTLKLQAKISTTLREGDSDLVKAGLGSLLLAGTAANTYRGTTSVVAGTLVLGKPAGVTAVPRALVVGGGTGVATVSLADDDQIPTLSSVTVLASGRLDLANQDETLEKLTLSGGTVTANTGRLILGGDLTVIGAGLTSTLEGTLDMGVGSRSIHVATGAVLNVAGQLVGPLDATLNKRGGGQLILSNDNSLFLGPLDLEDGVTTVNHGKALGPLVSNTSGPTDVRDGATLDLVAGIGAEALTATGPGYQGLGAVRNSNASGILLINGRLDISGVTTIVTQGDGISFGIGPFSLGVGDRLIKDGGGRLSASVSAFLPTVEVREGSFRGNAGSVTVAPGASLQGLSNITFGTIQGTIRLGGVPIPETSGQFGLTPVVPTRSSQLIRVEDSLKLDKANLGLDLSPFSMFQPLIRDLVYLEFSAFSKAITLNNVVLEIGNGVVLPGVEIFLIRTLSDQATITGQFTRKDKTTIEQGAVLTTFSGSQFRVNYTGGDGNDVTLTALDQAPAFKNRSVTPSINENGEVTVSGTITEPDPLDTFFLDVNWGDGKAETFTFAPGTPRDIRVRHRYRDNAPASGAYTINLFWHDQHGLGNSGVLTTTVRNVAPVVSVGGSVARPSGRSLSRLGSFRDPGADLWTATVDYGDGTGVQTLRLDAKRRFLLNHRFTRPGNYKVVVTVSDDDGGVGIGRIRVAISGHPRPYAVARFREKGGTSRYGA